MTIRNKFATLAAVAMMVLSGAAAARSADRRLPMDIDGGSADYSTDSNKPTVISGGVTIAQGTLHIQANRAEISMSNGDPSRALLTGAPVNLTQQLDDGTPMSAVASRVDYDLKAEIVVFTGNVSIKQPRGTLAGERVTYNMKSGQVASGGAAGGGRVKMRILPKGAP